MELYKEYEYEIGEIKRIQKELTKTSDSVQQYLQKQHENQSLISCFQEIQNRNYYLLLLILVLQNGKLQKILLFYDLLNL